MGAAKQGISAAYTPDSIWPILSPVQRVLPFRDDAFQVEAASLLEQALAVLLDVIDIENARALPAQEPLQPGFPLDQRQAPEILSVQVKQVECKEQAFPTPEQAGH
jgi:hypothetical protein